MKLRSGDGTEFALRVDGYEFPTLPGVGPDDWDANWLVVSGELTLADGRRHSFSEPCLTTWEADDLRTWLASLADGRVPAEREGPALVFTEPCVAFAASRLEDDGVEVRAYLSLEAEPPFVVGGAAGLFQNYVPLRTDPAALAAAAAAWADDLRPFPVRGPA